MSFENLNYSNPYMWTNDDLLTKGLSYWQGLHPGELIDHDDEDAPEAMCDLGIIDGELHGHLGHGISWPDFWDIIDGRFQDAGELAPAHFDVEPTSATATLEDVKTGYDALRSVVDDLRTAEGVSSFSWEAHPTLETGQVYSRSIVVGEEEKRYPSARYPTDLRLALQTWGGAEGSIGQKTIRKWAKVEKGIFAKDPNIPTGGYADEASWLTALDNNIASARQILEQQAVGYTSYDLTDDVEINIEVGSGASDPWVPPNYGCGHASAIQAGFEAPDDPPGDYDRVRRENAFVEVSRCFKSVVMYPWIEPSSSFTGVRQDFLVFDDMQTYSEFGGIGLGDDIPQFAGNLHIYQVSGDLTTSSDDEALWDSWKTGTLLAAVDLSTLTFDSWGSPGDPLRIEVTSLLVIPTNHRINLLLKMSYDTVDWDGGEGLLSVSDAYLNSFRQDDAPDLGTGGYISCSTSWTTGAYYTPNCNQYLEDYGYAAQWAHTVNGLAVRIYVDQWQKELFDLDFEP